MRSMQGRWQKRQIKADPMSPNRLSYSTPNSLEPKRLAAPAPRRKIPPVTILIGFTCHDAVVLASDSQASYPPSTTKQPDIKKVVVLKPNSPFSAVIAKAGILDTADYFQEFFELALGNANLADPRGIADCAETAMREVHGRLLRAKREAGFSGPELDQYLADNLCHIIVGYIHRNTPYLYSLSSISPHAHRCYHPFLAIGCAQSVASAVLTGHNLPTLDPIEAVGLAAYTVEMCKTHDSGCCGSTQVAILSAGGRQAVEIPFSAGPKISRVAQQAMADVQSALRAIVKEHLTKSGFMRRKEDADDTEKTT
jgi:20S proteasome alpha/beta subunit